MSSRASGGTAIRVAAHAARLLTGALYSIVPQERARRTMTQLIVLLAKSRVLTANPWDHQEVLAHARAGNLCINDGRRSRQFSTQPLFVLQLVRAATGFLAQPKKQVQRTDRHAALI